MRSYELRGVIEAPLDTVRAVFLRVTEGPVGPDNAPLLRGLPGAGRFLAGATLRGGPTSFTVHYGSHPGGTVEVGPSAFTFRGGYKFAADYEFTAHERGTLLTYRAHNVAPASHRDRPLVRAQFWLAGRLRIGLRGALRTIGGRLNCRTQPDN